ncbi:50S ribosomal protein L1 [bacterium (Candidatus Howlettbacteria) CG_4_10_14_0_8_um_filter_40_9]|nr:MAG: 50S ribosomal protein L1 [bacterium (Candidatus Howlettbacteria) CG_4_10_14_0_8_um_filter_40_9]
MTDTKKEKNEIKETEEEPKTLTGKKSVKASEKKETPKKKPVAKEKKDSGKPKKASTRTKPKLKKSERKHSKKYREVVILIEKDKEYESGEALELVKKTSVTKFDSSVEIHIKLGIDVKKTDQQIRGVVILPNGTGKSKNVCVICDAKLEKEAKEAGADTVGGADVIQKIEKGWLDFDVLVASPDMMGVLGKAAKILGPKGLMPNPKTETVTQEVGKAVKNIKKGQVEFKNDQAGVIHTVLGKVSFEPAKLSENLEALMDAIKKARPDASKGLFLKSMLVSSTMGPGIRVKI